MRPFLPSFSLLAFVLAACAAEAPPAPTPSGRAVSGDQMITLLRGNTTDGRATNGNTLQTYIAEDLSARLVVQTPGGGSGHYSGQVRSDGARLCWTWPQIQSGAVACFRLWQDGETFTSVPDGHSRDGGTFRILPGNPYNL